MGRSRTNQGSDDSDHETEVEQGAASETNAVSETGEAENSRETNAVSGTGETKALTQTEAEVESGKASGGEGVKGDEVAKSTDSFNPDPEVKNRLNLDVKTAEAEQFSAKTEREGGRDVHEEELLYLQRQVEKLQAEADEVIKRRDAARDLYDRAIEEQTVRNRANSQSVFSDYQKASQERRRQQREDADRLKRVQEAILGGGQPAQTNEFAGG